MYGVFHRGGLGKLMTVNEYEVWVCISDHPCVEEENDMVCFTSKEKKTVFVPWAFGSVVRAVKKYGDCVGNRCVSARECARVSVVEVEVGKW